MVHGAVGVGPEEQDIALLQTVNAFDLLPAALLGVSSGVEPSPLHPSLPEAVIDQTGTVEFVGPLGPQDVFTADLAVGGSDEFIDAQIPLGRGRRRGLRLRRRRLLFGRAAGTGGTFFRRGRLALGGFLLRLLLGSLLLRLLLGGGLHFLLLLQFLGDLGAVGIQQLQRLFSGETVHVQVVPLLEGFHSGDGDGAVNPIHFLLGQVPQLHQLFLQGFHVLPLSPFLQAIPLRGFSVQDGLGLAAGNAVLLEIVLPLEEDQRGLSAGAEIVGWLVDIQISQLHQPILEGGDRLALIVLLQRGVLGRSFRLGRIVWRRIGVGRSRRGFRSGGFYGRLYGFIRGIRLRRPSDLWPGWAGHRMHVGGKSHFPFHPRSFRLAVVYRAANAGPDRIRRGCLTGRPAAGDAEDHQ